MANPFRHRDNLNAQELIDCDIVECCKIETSVVESLDSFER